MNILVPDTWLREYLKTDATPKQLKEYLSLCGPSIERIHTIHGEIVYDIEVTSNRPDAMSIMGIAREASVILPRFGINAHLVGDPYTKKKQSKQSTLKHALPLTIKTDTTLNPRWVSVICDHVTVSSSPEWLKKRLELVGVRSINNVIDITNYVMHAYGQPTHVFDYDTITDGMMILRAAKKGETVTTLDGKTHTLPGGDIIIEDGSGTIIDLCGIMGGKKSAITQETKRVILFVQTYDPSHIRKTSMSLAHRTEAAGLFEKGLDTELVFPVAMESIRLLDELAGGKVASKITDIYPSLYKPPIVKTSRQKIDSYIGTHLDNKEMKDILTALGCQTTISQDIVTVLPPSFRRDIGIDVDVIEELARIYGYHTIKGKLPETEPPMVFEDPILALEQTIKTKLCDWGYTETYTYSMLSEELMNIFSLPKDETYAITNPLSSEWIYMRPTLLPSMLTCMKQNMSYENDLTLFELSMTYGYQKQDLPHEESTLIVAVSGKRYEKIKGIAEALCTVLSVTFPETIEPANSYYCKDTSLRMGNLGQLGEIHPTLLQKIGITKPITILELSVNQLLKARNKQKKYIPIPKYPASYEDIAFVVPVRTYVAPMLKHIQSCDPLINDVTLFDSFKDIRTFHITYQSAAKNLTADDISHAREKIIKSMKKEYNALLKTA